MLRKKTILIQIVYKTMWFCILYSWEFEVLTSLKIISDDLCGGNGLKSKVSTLEELYDFFSKKYSKITS